jgi:hypothetical protein
MLPPRYEIPDAIINNPETINKMLDKLLFILNKVN